MKYKKIILLILVLIWMVVIFCFSNKNTYKSNDDSKKFTYEVMKKVFDITNKTHITNVDVEVRSLELANKYNLYFRKLAHASIYFVLGIFVYLLFSLFMKKKLYLFTIIICFIYAISDEIHQMFVLGRTSSFVDVLIDTLGCMFGLFIIFCINKLRSRKDEEN